MLFLSAVLLLVVVFLLLVAVAASAVSVVVVVRSGRCRDAMRAPYPVRLGDSEPAGAREDRPPWVRLGCGNSEGIPRKERLGRGDWKVATR